MLFRSYLDYLMGYGPLILGHAHPAVVNAVTAQVSRGSHFYLVNEPAIALAKAVRRVVPNAERVRFLGSGSEAVQAALRLARARTGRSKVLKFEGAFHGTGDYAQHNVVPAAKPDFPHARPDSAGIPPAVSGEVLVAPFNDLETTGRIIAAHATDLAAVLVEPLQRSIPPKPAFLEGLSRITSEHGVQLIFDEVITGFRLALGGAQELYGVRADITCYGKVLGGGLPLAAIAGRADVMDLADPRRYGASDYAIVSGTLNGNPLCCAAGLATLAELEQTSPYAGLASRAHRLRSGLRELGARHGFAIQTPGAGSVFQVLFAEEEPFDGVSLAQVNWPRTNRFSLEMIARGFLLYRVAFLSVAHTDADIDRTLEAAEDVLKRMKNAESRGAR